MTDADKDKEKLPLDLQIQTLTRNNGILKKAYMEVSIFNVLLMERSFCVFVFDCK
jgi:hypothetical protein